MNTIVSIIIFILVYQSYGLSKIYMLFSGGGVRGYGSAIQLALLEKELGFPLFEIADAVGGTSIGSINAAAVASKKFKGEDLVHLYQNHAVNIFSSSRWNRLTSAGGMLGPLYDRAYFDQVIAGYFDDMQLSSSPIPFTAIAVGKKELPLKNWGYPEALVFQSVEAKKNPKKDLPLSTVISISSSAPGYFSPFVFDYDDSHWLGFDGGLADNTPHLTTIFGNDTMAPVKGDIVLSFYTGYEETTIFDHGYKKNGGLMNHLYSLVYGALDARDVYYHQLSSHVLTTLGLRHAEFDFPLSSKHIDLTTPEYFQEIEEKATLSFQKWKSDNPKFLDTLRARAEKRDDDDSIL